MKNYKITVLLLSVFLISCIEEYDIKLKSSDQRIVIEATLTNDSTQCLVRITKSRVNLYNTSVPPSGTILYEPVRDALVILTDNTGQCDTAFAIDPPVYDKVLDRHLAILYNQYFVFNPFTNMWERELDGHALDMVWYRKFVGYYTTSKFVGVAGRTYRLYVKSEGKEYVAEAIMPAPAPAIDSIAVKRLYNETEHETYDVPLVYFKEPQNEKNYYLISLKDEFWLHTSGGKLALNLVSDEYLPAYVNGLAVVNEKDWFLLFNWNYQVHIFSLTKEAYNFYKIFLEQTENDGGAYSPAPANLPGNFTNGALGYFRASSTSVLRITPRK